ncbi:MAG: hypothetical protein LBD14_06440 [Puniceicoccales bacterium]|jgi:hypothetical protein|nr:hypothetical protein [Puniceicoccales bacterium]
MPAETTKRKKNIPKQKPACATATGNHFFFLSPIMLLLMVGILLPPNNCLASQLNESPTTSTNSPAEKSPDLSQQSRKTVTSLKRQTEWSSRKTQVLNSRGKLLPATLYTAKHESPDYDERFHKEGDEKIGILHLDSEGIRAMWIIVLPLREHSASFIEKDGDLYTCILGDFSHLVLFKNPMIKDSRVEEFIFANDRLDGLVIEAPPPNRVGVILNMSHLFDLEFFSNAPMGSRYGKMVFKKISFENDVFCFELENISPENRLKGRVWVDLGKMKIFKTENITQLTDPRDRVELKPRILFPWKAKGSPVATTSYATYSPKVLTSAGTEFPVNLYWAGIAFNKTLSGARTEWLKEAVWVFHANRQGKDRFWIEAYRSIHTNGQNHLIEANDELVVCNLLMTELRFVNTWVKIEKTNRNFVFSEDVLNGLFYEAYSTSPELPYKFRMDVVNIADFFDKDFFYVKPDDGGILEAMVIEKITAKDGIFCIVIKNSSINCRGKVWIDPNGYKVVKAEGIKAEDMPVSPSEPQAEKQ